MNSTSIVEDSAAFFSIDLMGADGNPEAPLQAFVSVYCLTNQLLLRAEAALPVIGSTMAFNTSSLENRLIDRSNLVEVKRIVLRAPYGQSDQFSTYFDYDVTQARPI